jgi:hypothetical protein
MIRYVLAAAILLVPLSTAANGAVECKAELPAARSGHWSWRNIDGKRCWYPGQPGVDRASLQWPRSTPTPARNDAAPDQALLESYWPKLEELPFEERWPQ